MVMDMHMNKLAIGISLLVIGFITYFLSPIYDAVGLLTLASTIVYGAGQGLVASSIDFEKPSLISFTNSRDSFLVLLLFPIFLHFPGVGYTFMVTMGLVIGLFAVSFASKNTESIK